MAIEKQMPLEIEGMVTVSQAAFFAVVGGLDVTPYPVGNYDPIFGYRSHWKRRNHMMVGITVGGTWRSHHRFMVTREFFEENRIAIAAATN